MKILFKKKYSILIYSIIIAMFTLPFSILLDYKIANEKDASGVKHITSAVSQELASLETVLISFESLLNSTKDNEDIEVSNFAEQILKSFPYINSFIEMKKISVNDVLEFEQYMNQKGFIDLKLKKGEANKEKYVFPINLVEPMTPFNAKLLGLDMYSFPVFFESIKIAIQTGKISASLISDLASTQPNIWLFKATYTGRYPPKNNEERIASNIGLVAIKLNVNKLMALYSMTRFNLNAQLNNIQEAKEKEEITSLIELYNQKYKLVFLPKKSESPINILKMVLVWLLIFVLSYLILSLLKRRRLAEDELMVSQNRFLKIAEATPIGIFQTDIAGDYIFTNEAYQEITNTQGVSLKESNKNHIYPDDIQKVSNEWRSSVKEKRDFDLSYRHSLPNNDFIWVHCKVKAERDGSNKILSYIGTIENITEQKRAEEKIYQQAHFDHLTSLANRFLILNTLENLLNKAIRSNSKLALLFLDLDGFKKINDTLGHEAGDEILIETASRLKKTVRTVDRIGRLGGDEFLILLDEITNVSDIHLIAKKIIQQFNKPFTVDGHEVVVTTSIGVSLFPDDSKNTSELLRHADMAMYHAKELGSNTYSFFTDKLNKNKARWFEIDERLHGALDRNEFSVFYQPKLELSTGKVIGAEALIRWNNQHLGNVSPVEFIPIAEKSDIIIRIGEFVLNEALSMAKKWHDKFGNDFQIAVNLSPKQFRDTNLIKMIINGLEKHQVSSSNLELEITEGVLLNKHLNIKEQLLEISELGISIAIDDFGTGYSSLNYLRSYPFNTLKIDRSFINEMATNSSDSELVNASIAMAHALKLKVVAEGIESKEQLTILKEYNCDYGQGYLFDKPLSFQEIIKKREEKVYLL